MWLRDGGEVVPIGQLVVKAGMVSVILIAEISS